jgi:AAA domain
MTENGTVLATGVFLVSSVVCVYTLWSKSEPSSDSPRTIDSDYTTAFTELVRRGVSNLRTLFGHEVDSQAHAVQQILASGGNQKIYKFVLTGGPCSGKTTSMERLQVFLRERGFRVFVAPEAATLLFINGASVDDFARPDVPLAFQKFVIKTQMSLEDSLYTYAKATGEDCVILCDRGIMDGSAYVDTETWNRILDVRLYMP